MGTWHIHIEGQGPHHNESHADAERLAKDFTDTLAAHGHHVSRAEFTTTGVQQDLSTGKASVSADSKESPVTSGNRH